MSAVKRTIEDEVLLGLKQYPIVALTGPRQSGKTTMLREFFDGYSYVSLENPDVRQFAKSDPAGFFERYDKYVILDEVQRVPELFSYMQTIVDENRLMGQFILSGSHNFQLMENITQSLAGRVALFKLLPFDADELRSEQLLPETWREVIVKGFYPAIYDRGLKSANFYNNYVQTYVERDVALITKIQDRRRFLNFLGLCAARHDQLLNFNNLANECGISQPTAKSWLTVLESSYLIFLLQPYYENYNKRIVKSPKLYFYDTGLLCYLLGIRKTEDLSDQVLMGSLFENLAVAETIKQNEHRNLLENFMFWRSASGKEVDMIVKHGNSYDVYEIKKTGTITNDLFSNMDYFDDLTGNRVRNKTLIYGGRDVHDRTHYKIRTWDTALA